MSEKFNDRKVILYNSDNSNIQKAIISRTGFYALIDMQSMEKLEVELMDENNSIKCFYLYSINNEPDVGAKCILVSNFSNTESKELKLIINGKEYKLAK